MILRANKETDMMTRENFKKYMTVIQDFFDEEYILNSLLKKISDGGVTTYGNNLLTAYMSLLEESMGCKSQDVEYFIYECDMGRNPKTVTYPKENKSFLLDSIDALYDLIEYSNSRPNNL